MVQKQMELHRPLGLANSCPVEQARAQLNDCGIRVEEFVVKVKVALSKVQLPVFFQKLAKDLLIPRQGLS